MWVKKGKYTPDNMPTIGYRVVSLASLRKRRWKPIKGRFKHTSKQVVVAYR